MSAQKEPEYSPSSGWTCPEGYAYARCPGCGHNYFGGKPYPKVNGKAADGGLCHWCVAEEANE